MTTPFDKTKALELIDVFEQEKSRLETSKKLYEENVMRMIKEMMTIYMQIKSNALILQSQVLT